MTYLKLTAGAILALLALDPGLAQARHPRSAASWSVSSPEARTTPQYWQVLRSRRRMFLRESARV